MEGSEVMEFWVNASTDTQNMPIAGWYPEIARIVLVTTSFLTIIANILVLVVFQYMKPLENMTNVFVKSLAVADLGVGIFVFIAVQSQWAANWQHGMWSCKLMGYLLATMVGGSILSLTCVSIDRYVAIIKPLQYRTIVTKRRARLYAVTLWTLVAFLFFPSMFCWGGYICQDYASDCKNHFDQSLRLSFCIICILIVPSLITSIFCYFHILKACLAQTRQMERIETLFQEREAGQDITSRLYERMLAKMFLIVISAFYISWIPFLVQKIVELSTASRIHPAVSFFTAWLGFLNSFLNCFIYIIGHRSFRDGLCLLLRSIWTRIPFLCKKSKKQCMSVKRSSPQSQIQEISAEC